MSETMYTLRIVEPAIPGQETELIIGESLLSTDYADVIATIILQAIRAHQLKLTSPIDPAPPTVV